MKIEYNAERDLLYIYFQKTRKKVAKTKTVIPGINADFDMEEKLLGLEIIDASEFIDEKIEFDLFQVKRSA